MGLKAWARALKRDVHAVWLAARDRRTPWYAKALALAVAGYALSPIDLIPDFIPVLGYLDDLILVPAGIWLVLRLIPAEVLADHRAAAEAAADRPVSRVAAAVVIVAWIAFAIIAGLAAAARLGESPPMSDAHPALRTFGRIKSRPIKPRQAALLETLLPTIRPPAGPFDPRDLMPGAREVWLEVGFGGGEHMAAQAGRHPDALIIGCEPFINGVASGVRHIDEAGLTNVRVHDGDARALMGRLPDGCLDRIFVLFPDPWPKTRHHKRRIIQPETAAEFARLLKAGGRLRFASDVAHYVDWALEHITASPRFAWTALVADDWRKPPTDHVTTRYEEKRLGDCAPVFLDFVRV